MMEIWRLNAEIRSGVLLVDENHTLNLMGDIDDKTSISFDFPQKAESITWQNWDHCMPQNAWDYKITYKFCAKNEDAAQKIAWRKLENIVAFLSFLASAPVIIKSHGSITNAPDNPIIGTQYTTISLTFEQGWVGRKQPAIDSSDIGFLTQIIMPDKIMREGQERILRSIRWLQNSYFSSSPVEEFMSLMLAFEAVSHLLKPSKKNYWQCPHCGEDMASCPKCGESTEWAGSGKIGMEYFVTEILKWESSDWKSIWKYRNLVFHGSQDLTSEQQQEIFTKLHKLETATVNAIRYILRFPENAPPRSLRQRGRFYGAKFYAKWIKNDEPVSSNSNEGQ